MSIKGVLAFDIDGTLTRPNHKNIEPEGLPGILNRLGDFGYVSIPVTGKPVSYAAELLEINKLHHNGIIAENAGVYVCAKRKKIEFYGDGIDAMDRLLERIDVLRKVDDFQRVSINNKECEVVIDPGDFSILTVFTDPETVSHRWNFKYSVDAKEVYEFLVEVVSDLNLSNSLEVLKPFSDGAVQVIRKDRGNGKTYSKENILDVISRIHGEKVSGNVAMFGDGHNDIPAMKPNGIKRITFSNGDPELKDFVNRNGGCITNECAPGLGIIEGLRWLLECTDFFDDNKREVKKILS